MTKSKPAISIICNAYNHEKYIRQALESFVIQEVSVPYEILVNDDASTDGTAEVIREFEKRYPDVMRPLYQTENQYSKGIKITPEIQLARARGKYVAFCEGDDYWTDAKKLQIQYDFMEAHPDYSICCHAYSMVDKEGNLIEERHDLRADGIVPIENLIGNQLLVPHYSTMFIRMDCLSGFDRLFLDKPTNDMLIRLYCMAQKPVYYIDRNMSSYRRFTENSWTVRVGMNHERFLTEQKATMHFLKRYDDYTGKKYTSAIAKELDRRSFEIALMMNDYKDARKNPTYKKASWKRRVGIIIGCFFPKLMNRIRKV